MTKEKPLSEKSVLGHGNVYSKKNIKEAIKWVKG